MTQQRVYLQEKVVLPTVQEHLDGGKAAQDRGSTSKTHKVHLRWNLHPMVGEYVNCFFFFISQQNDTFHITQKRAPFIHKSGDFIVKVAHGM